MSKPEDALYRFEDVVRGVLDATHPLHRWTSVVLPDDDNVFVGWLSDRGVSGVVFAGQFIRDAAAMEAAWSNTCIEAAEQVAEARGIQTVTA